MRVENVAKISSNHIMALVPNVLCDHNMVVSIFTLTRLTFSSDGFLNISATPLVHIQICYVLPRDKLIDGKSTRHYHHNRGERSHPQILHWNIHQPKHLIIKYLDPYENHTPKCHQISHTPNLKQKKTCQQTSSCPPSSNEHKTTTLVRKPTSQRRHSTLYHIMVNHDQHKANMLTFMPVHGYRGYFILFHWIKLSFWYQFKYGSVLTTSFIGGHHKPNLDICHLYSLRATYHKHVLFL